MEHFKRFQKARDSRREEDLICYKCPYAENVEYTEKLRFPEMYKNWPNYRDGMLVQTAYRPKIGCKQCEGCYQEWLDEKKEAGKVCVMCGSWILKEPGIQMIEEYEGGGKTKTSVCEGCLDKLIENLTKKEGCDD